ncbi:tRNA (guanine-N1)-methyltransferase [Hyunsoonleella ulvae]|uniref:tRNA (guanine-N1)-methyltransferase n=1 Tax=Hyunsoonleella ulvae TaxID=2799948 RepID=UPI00193A3E99|nr:tRNA (guanine-N1)-methyltransferase [Hyunsoonleella ulvae]
MNSSKYLIAFIFLFTFRIAFSQTAQQPEALSLNSGTIDSQFEFIFRKSGNFKGTNGQPYEAVKTAWLLTLRNHVKDSLNGIRKNLNETQAVVKTQANEITQLKSSLSKTQANLDKTNTEKDSMSLFGMQMSKTGYNTLLWSIIAALLALLLLFIYKFKNSNAVTRQAKLSLSEIEEEFEEHRKTALEREQKVRRQLQDEINKQKKA